VSDYAVRAYTTSDSAVNCGVILKPHSYRLD